MFQVEEHTANGGIFLQDFGEHHSVAASDVHQSFSGEPAEIVGLERRTDDGGAEASHGIVENVADALVFGKVVETWEPMGFLGYGFASANSMSHFVENLEVIGIGDP